MLFPLLAKSHPSPDQCVCQETMRDQLCHTDYCRRSVSVPTRLHTLETRALYSATTYYAQIERINQQNQSKPYFQGQWEEKQEFLKKITVTSTFSEKEQLVWSHLKDLLVWGF